jgi:hypothetical protein
MKRAIFILLAFCHSVLYGQESNETVLLTGPKFHQYFVGVYVSPNVGFRSLKNEDGRPRNNTIIQSRKNEAPKLGFEVGLSFAYRFNYNWSVESGIRYINQGYQTDRVEYTNGVLTDPRIDFLYSVQVDNTAEHAKFISNYHYLGIPIKINYMAGKRNVRFIGSLGFVTDFLVSAKTTGVSFHPDGSTMRNVESSTRFEEKIGFLPTVSAGIMFGIARNVEMRVEPYFGYNVLTVRDAPIYTFLYNGGIRFNFVLGL